MAPRVPRRLPAPARWGAALGLLGVVLAAWPGVETSRGEDEIQEIDWRSDLAEARADAQRTGRPMLVVFRCVP